MFLMPARGRLCVVRCRLSPRPALLTQPIVCVSGTLAPCLSAGASDCMLQAVGCRKSSCIFNANYEHQRQPRANLLIGNVRAVGCCRPVYLQQPGTTCRLVCVSGGLARFLRWTVAGCYRGRKKRARRLYVASSRPRALFLMPARGRLCVVKR